jgi:heptosyltransferase II
MTDASPSNACRVAVIHPHRGVGDLMWHVPFIRVIAEQTPGGQVTLITRSSTRADCLLAAESCIADVVYTPFSRGAGKRVCETWGLGRLLRRRGITTVWILDKISRPAIAAAFAGVSARHGFGFRSQRRWLTNRRGLPRGLEKAHQIDKLKAFLDMMGLPPADLVRPLTIVAAAADRVDDLFGYLPRPWVVLGTDASETSKMWPVESFSTFMRALTDASDATIFLQSGPSQTAFVRAVNDAAAPVAGIDVSMLNMAEIAALCARADLFIGNDSGPMNVAATMGTHVVALFGGSPPLSHTPFYHPIVPPAGMRGMAAITPAIVLDCALDLLRRGAFSLL